MQTENDATHTPNDAHAYTGRLALPQKTLILPAERKTYTLKGHLVQAGVELGPGAQVQLLDRQAEYLRSIGVI